MELNRHEGHPDRCLVLLPGVRYFSQAPLLWFAREAAQAAGFTVLELTERAPADREPFEWMRERAANALDEAAGAAETVVIGKSLGSAAAPLAAERGLAAVWLTPLLIRPDVVAALNAATQPTLLVGSRADPTWSDGQMPSTDALEVMEIQGLDHSLQVPGDPFASIEVLRQVTSRLAAFLGALPASPGAASASRGAPPGAP
jgi:hypothetical protein